MESVSYIWEWDENMGGGSARLDGEGKQMGDTEGKHKLVTALYLWCCGVVMSGEDAPRPYLEDLIVLEIKTNKQTRRENTNKERTGETRRRNTDVR
jgi:hypothetical protein